MGTIVRLSIRQLKSPNWVAFSKTSINRSPISTRSGRMKSGRSLLATVIRSSVSRCIRESSSKASSRVRAVSWGSLGFNSSRCPRTTVMGVRSSCPTSFNRSRCSSKLDCRRAIIEFIWRVTSARSSSPSTGKRLVRSCSLVIEAIRFRNLPIGASNGWEARTFTRPTRANTRKEMPANNNSWV